MVGGAGGAQGSHRIRKAQLCQCHHIHIAFSHQGIAFFTQMGTRFEQAIELTPFAKYRGFWRIEVLRFFITQHASAKAYALAFDIAYGKHHAVAEAVVAFFFAAFFGVANYEAAFHQQGVVVLGEYAGQAAPALWGVAQAETLGHFAREATSFEVGHGTRRVFELAPVGFPGFFQHAGQRVLLFFLFLGPRAVLG